MTLPLEAWLWGIGVWRFMCLQPINAKATKCCCLAAFILSVCVGLQAAAAQTPNGSVLQRSWFQARTAHFEVYSCGTTQQVCKVLERLEQFREAYLLLAG